MKTAKASLAKRLDRLTFWQKVCHLLGSASATHKVFEQYQKPKHQIQLFFLPHGIKS